LFSINSINKSANGLKQDATLFLNNLMLSKPSTLIIKFSPNLLLTINNHNQHSGVIRQITEKPQLRSSRMSRDVLKSGNLRKNNTARRMKTVGESLYLGRT
jgi:hypothetical protein